MRTFGEAPPPPTFFERLKSGLAKTGLGEILTKKKLDAETIAELEEALIRADMGAGPAHRIAQGVAKGRYDAEITAPELKDVLAAEIAAVLAPVQKPLQVADDKKPFVILVAGVNGTGKTTTIGKLAKRLAEDGAKVTLAAGDTFRAAAIEQLRVWAGRAKRRIRRRQAGRRCGRPCLRGAGESARQWQRHSSDRHGRPAAEQGGPDGRTGKDRARDQEA